MFAGNESARDDQFPELALRSIGYHCAFHGEKSYNGVAILSKTELRDVRLSLCDEVEDPQARVIAATIDDVRVYSIYALANPGRSDHRLTITN